MSHSLKVIAGRYGGRKLSAPRGMATRPTGARVREALFSILGELTDANVLDLYAGTGALAIEALSRGARSAVLVEHERAALECIRANVSALELESLVTIVPLRLPRALSAALPNGPFELVLCDPPWADIEAACATLARLTLAGGLASGARVVLEHSARDADPVAAGLALTDRRAWGDTAVSLFRTA